MSLLCHMWFALETVGCHLDSHRLLTLEMCVKTSKLNRAAISTKNVNTFKGRLYLNLVSVRRVKPLLNLKIVIRTEIEEKELIDVLTLAEVGESRIMKWVNISLFSSRSKYTLLMNILVRNSRKAIVSTFKQNLFVQKIATL